MEVILQHVNEPPVRPSERTPEIWMMREVEEIIMACLEKEPAKRPESAAAVAERLRNLQLADAWTFEKAEAWWKEYQPVTRADVQPADSLPEETIESRFSHVTSFQIPTHDEP